MTQRRTAHDDGQRGYHVDMSTTVKGLIIIVVVGLVVLVIAALADRRARLHVEGGDAKDVKADSPNYLSATELLRRSPASPRLDADDALRGATRVDLRLASKDLATHDRRRSLAPDTRVLVCDDPVTTVRELLPVWQQLPPAQALTIAAPGFDADVLTTLAANLAGGTRLVQPLVGDAGARSRLADLTGATPQRRYNLQAGDVSSTVLGHAALIAASLDDTQVAQP